MSDLFDVLQERYQALVARTEGGEASDEFLQDARDLIADARQAGAGIADLDERSQLRAWMRFLAHAVADATGIYPDVTLQPLARGQLAGPRPESAEQPARSFPPAWVWTLIGGAAGVILAVGLAASGWLSRPHETAVEPLPAPASLPFVSQFVVGTGLDASGTLEMATDTLCLGTPELVARFTLEEVQPETEWHWEVRRGDEVVASQSAAPWGSTAQPITVRVLAGGPAGVEPGQYDLLLYAGQQVVGMRSFQVLDQAPRLFNLRVADVPAPAEAALGQSAFEAGVRAIYLGYEFEGLCPGLDVSYTLYHGGASVQERAESWSGMSQGHSQASFQPADDLPFPAGDYEAVVTMAGQEQGRVKFTMGEVAEEAVPPAFGDVTIALGAQPDGTPIAPAPGNRFDWNTKVVYAIFDTVGMQDGLRWMAAWVRNGQEVAREEYLWDGETAGTAGTYWVTYDAGGQVLPGGTYSVTLYIENVAQRSADFQILYYVPRE